MQEDKDACIEAFRFFRRMQAGEQTETEDETKAIAAYHKVLNNMLSVFDLEKLYIPPQLDPKQGLYGNHILCEQALVEELALAARDGHILLDMGCGRGRIAHRFAAMTGGQVSGYNIDPDQIDNAVEWAASCDMNDRLHQRSAITTSRSTTPPRPSTGAIRSRRYGRSSRKTSWTRTPPRCSGC